MMGADTQPINLVYEFNVHLAEPAATIWVIPGAYDPDSETECDPSEHPLAMRFAGPIQLNQCRCVFDGLKDLLESLGHTVHTFETADD